MEKRAVPQARLGAQAISFRREGTKMRVGKWLVPRHIDYDSLKVTGQARPNFGAGFFGCEHAIDAGSGGVSLFFPCGNFVDEAVGIVHSAAQALAAEHADLDLDHVKPTGMTGSVVVASPAVAASSGRAPREGLCKPLPARYLDRRQSEATFQRATRLRPTTSYQNRKDACIGGRNCSTMGGIGRCPQMAKVTRSNRVGCTTDIIQNNTGSATIDLRTSANNADFDL
jgi:hypothetical protein